MVTLPEAERDEVALLVERNGASETSSPSRTAMMAALGRTGHMVHYGFRALLCDWLAWPLIGADAEAMLADLRPAVGIWRLRSPRGSPRALGSLRIGWRPAVVSST